MVPTSMLSFKRKPIVLYLFKDEKTRVLYLLSAVVAHVIVTEKAVVSKHNYN
jgi:hypothetical protein